MHLVFAGVQAAMYDTSDRFLVVKNTIVTPSKLLTNAKKATVCLTPGAIPGSQVGEHNFFLSFFAGFLEMTDSLA